MLTLQAPRRPGGGVAPERRGPSAPLPYSVYEGWRGARRSAKAARARTSSSPPSTARAPAGHTATQRRQVTQRAVSVTAGAAGSIAPVVAGAITCGLLVGGAPGFANLGIGLMGHAQYVSGYLIALVSYLAGAALTLGLLARESALAEVAAADPAALEAERCLLYLRGRGAGEMQAQALLRIAQGGTAAQIAEELHIARGTVNAYRARGYQLLGVHSARELTQLLARDTGGRAG